MWQGILEHDDVVDRFRASVRRGRLASTYLFVGPAGIGKKRFALVLAKALLCQQPASDASPDADLLDPCGRCESCRLFDAGSHPDLDMVSLPKDKSTLPLELFIGDKEHRNQDGLCHRIALRPFLGGRKVAIIDDADHFNEASANCLLKTLEEPPPKSLMILIGTSPSKQLPTIRSRSQVVRFEPLSPGTLAEILLSTGIVADAEHAVRLASFGEGSVERARDIADPALWQFRAALLHDLSSAAPNPVRMAKAIQTFVDEAGKEASERRVRLRTVVAFAEEFFRAQMRTEAGGNPGGDDLLQTSLAKAAKNQTVFRPLDALEACLSVVENVDRNANLGLVIQRWCEELTGGRVAV
jgi:DNA polymerase-3 subunit delta'